MSKSFIFPILTCALAIGFFAFPSSRAGAAKPSQAGASAEAELLRKLDSVFQVRSMSMSVSKVAKISTLDQEHSAKGNLWVSKGRLRMDLDGSEKSRLVLNKKNLWAITFPSEEFKNAKINVIRGDLGSKKVRSQNVLTLLTQGGFQRVFLVTMSRKTDGGEVLLFLSPKKDQEDFTRAQLRVSADGQRLMMLKYWDALSNETTFEFANHKFDPKFEAGFFDYSPPTDANVMNL